MLIHMLLCFFFFKQKTAYEMRISDWSSDVCSSDLVIFEAPDLQGGIKPVGQLLGGYLIHCLSFPLLPYASIVVAICPNGNSMPGYFIHRGNLAPRMAAFVAIVRACCGACAAGFVRRRCGAGHAFRGQRLYPTDCQHPQNGV